MKKLICLLVCFCLVASVTVTAASSYDASISRVCGIGIMGNVEDGEFRADDPITRAEFTAVALRMLGVFNLTQSDTVFSDVPAGHWASGHIAMASDMGIINGRGGGMFAPEDSVTYAEAVKIIVCALGYDAAIASPVYPASYLTKGDLIGVTKGVDYTEGPLTRAQVAALADNALDICPLEPVYGTDSYEVSDETLFEKLSRIKDTSLFSGILNESGNISLSYTPVLDSGYIQVDGVPFRTNEAYDDLIGQYVDVYYTENSGGKTVVSISPQAYRNTVYTLPADDTAVADGKVTYCDESDNEKYYRLASDAVILLNGDRIIPPQSLEIYLGSYTLIDNDDNNIIDVVSVTQAESFIVENVSAEGGAFYFDNNRTYHGRNGFVVDYSDDEREYLIVGSAGNEIEFGDIEPGDAVSIVGNSDDTFVKLVVSSESVSGSIDGISDSTITVEGQEFPVGKASDGSLLFSPYLGMEGTFAVDAFGCIIGSFGQLPDKFSYGYIAAATVTGGMDAELKVKIVSGTEPKKDVKVSNGDETVSYYLQNDDVKVYTLADSFKFGKNPTDARGVKTLSEDVTPDMLQGKIAGYTLNADGEINALNVYTVPSNFSSYEFNAEIFSFGGIRVSRGFVKDDNTTVVCVPNVVRSEDDFGVRVKITDENSYKVYGVLGISENEYGTEEANAEPVDIIIVKADMDSSLAPNIPADNEICIIGQVSSRLNADSEEVCVVELLNGSDKEVYEVPSDSLAYADVKKLRKGDLIQFTTNSKSEIANVRLKASVQGLTDYTDEENIYGIIDDVKYNIYDYFSNEMSDLIYVNTGNDITKLKLFKSDGQNVYLYDRKSGYIYPATSNDIMAASYYGTKASKIFALMENNDAEVIVLIKD